MTHELELKVNRRNTVAFIEERPTTIVLKPQRKVRSATGGYTYAFDPPRAPQTFRIIEKGVGLSGPSAPIQRTLDGIERTLEFMLLGDYSADIARYDVWTDDEERSWEITELYADNGYEVRAIVVRHGD